MYITDMRVLNTENTILNKAYRILRDISDESWLGSKQVEHSTVSVVVDITG